MRHDGRARPTRRRHGGAGQRLPLTTISELLGVPDVDRPWLRLQAMALMTMGPDTSKRAAEAKADLRAYFTDLTARRRHTPREHLDQRAGDRADRRRRRPVHRRTRRVGDAAAGSRPRHHHLSDRQHRLHAADSARRLAWIRDNRDKLPHAIEEVLRHIPFRQGVGIPRVATQDVELEGTLIAAGDFVHVSYLAANRDPSVYERPDELDFERTDAPPHMTFGNGFHRCLGPHLARMMLEKPSTPC